METPVLYSDATVKTVHPAPDLEREHVLLPSRSGRRFCVLEVDAEQRVPGLAEAGWRLEAFEVSGWRSRVNAERFRQALGERWLSDESKARMRAGETVSVAELRWATRS